MSSKKGYRAKSRRRKKRRSEHAQGRKTLPKQIIDQAVELESNGTIGIIEKLFKTGEITLDEGLQIGETLLGIIGTILPFVV